MMYTQEHPNQSLAQPSPQGQKSDPSTKIKVFKIIIVVLALVCMIMVIFIMAKSSQYFSYLFKLGTEDSSKKYLRNNYKAFLTSLYFSIMGFIVVLFDTILFFYKFLYKTKILYFHIVYFLCFFISGIVALTQSEYLVHMTYLLTSPSLSACIASGLLNQCYLSSAFITFRGQFVSFFVVFILFFVPYAILYHYAVLKVLPLQVQEGKKKDGVVVRSSIGGANKKNETLVSEAFDQYLA